MKIVWQSLNSLEEMDEYAALLREYLGRVAREDTEIELMGVPEGIGHNYRSFQLFDETAANENFLGLRHRDDVDGVAIGNASDPALRPAREVLEVPVLGYLETSVLTAHMLADRFAIVSVTDKVESLLRDRVRTYGLDERLVGVYGPAMPLRSAGEAISDEDTREEFIASYEQLLDRAIRDGAELVIPGGGIIPILLHHLEGKRRHRGVPILDTTSLLVCWTETMVHLYECDALETSRAGMYRPPPEEFLAELGNRYDV